MRRQQVRDANRPGWNYSPVISSDSLMMRSHPPVFGEANDLDVIKQMTIDFIL
jgi:hypothetical protein